MPRVTIIGRRRLKGKVRCEGAKNAALPIMAASILSKQVKYAMFHDLVMFR